MSLPWPWLSGRSALGGHRVVDRYLGERPAPHQRVPLAPERADLQLVVDQGLVALHAPRDVGPLHLARDEAPLAGLERLDVVRRGEATRAEEGQEVVEAQGTVVGGLVPRREGPGVDLDVIVRGGEERPDG